jgi:hypothetical protein
VRRAAPQCARDCRTVCPHQNNEEDRLDNHGSSLRGSHERGPSKFAVRQCNLSLKAIACDKMLSAHRKTNTWTKKVYCLRVCFCNTRFSGAYRMPNSGICAITGRSRWQLALGALALAAAAAQLPVILVTVTAMMPSDCEKNGTWGRRTQQFES